MPLYKRKDIPKLLADIEKKGSPVQVYLIWGERYLCRNAAQEIIDRLLPEAKRHSTSLVHIDGDQEDFNKTLSLLKTFSLFSGPQVIWVTDSKLFLSKGVAKNLWEKAVEKNERNEAGPARRYLLQMLKLASIALGDPEKDIGSLSAARWKTLFGFPRPKDKITWAADLLADVTPDASSEKKQDSDVSSLFTRTFKNGIPEGNILVLVAEAVDKRKKLYKFIQKNGVVIDLDVEGGSSTAARRDQDKVLTELIHSTLNKYGKKIESKVLPVLLERVGFHPVAAVLEAEKLALYVEDRKNITRKDIDAIIGRTREEALFELTEAVSAGRLEDGLVILNHLQDNGVHGLAIIATLKNHLEKLLLIRSLQELPSPSYSKSISYPSFQKKYLPELKEGRDEWSTLLWKNHPYGLFKMFEQASRFKLATLQDGLQDVLAAEYRMKSSSLDSRIVMDNLLFSLMDSKKPGASVA